MRARGLMTVLILSVLAGCDGGDPAPPPKQASAIQNEPPQRAPGLWRLTIAMKGIESVSTLCLDPAVDKKLAWWGGAVGDDCTQSVEPVGGGWRFSSSCPEMKGGRTLVTGDAKGDFTSHYEIAGQTSFAGAAPGATEAWSMTAAHQGACPAGMAPGMMDLPDHRRINTLDMSQVW